MSDSAASQIKVKDKVSFVDADGNIRSGIVIKIIRRTKESFLKFVMLPIAFIEDKDGEEYWIPVECLTKI
jgi:hypothetical protein